MPGMLAVQGSAGGALTSSSSAAGLAAAFRAARILLRPAFSAASNSALAMSNTLFFTSSPAKVRALATRGAPLARETMRTSLS